MTPATAHRLCVAGRLSGGTVHVYRAESAGRDGTPVEAVAARLDLESRLRALAAQASGPSVKH